MSPQRDSLKICMIGEKGYIRAHAQFQVISLHNLKDIQAFSTKQLCSVMQLYSYDHLHTRQILIF